MALVLFCPEVIARRKTTRAGPGENRGSARLSDPQAQRCATGLCGRRSGLRVLPGRKRSAGQGRRGVFVQKNKNFLVISFLTLRKNVKPYPFRGIEPKKQHKKCEIQLAAEGG